MAGEGRILAVNAFLLSLATLASTFQSSGFFIITFNATKPPPKELYWDTSRPRVGGYPTFKRLHGKMRPRTGRVTAPQM